MKMESFNPDEDLDISALKSLVREIVPIVEYVASILCYCPEPTWSDSPMIHHPSCLPAKAKEILPEVKKILKDKPCQE